MEQESSAFSELSCRAFTERLAAKQPVPGGGGAAAMAGALAAALGSMAGHYTEGKKKYAVYETELMEMLAQLEEIRTRLLDAIEADAAAFAPLSRAYGIPKDDPGRDAALQQATEAAALPPLTMMREAGRIVPLLVRMASFGNRMMVSDIGCGLILAAAALRCAALNVLRCAALNVLINTAAMRDREKAAELEREADALLQDCVPAAREAADRIQKEIRT